MPSSSIKGGGRVRKSVTWSYFRLILRSIDFTMSRIAMAVDCGMKLLGPLLIVVAVALYTLCTYTYFAHIVVSWRTSLTHKALVTAVGVFLLVNMVYNYLKACFTNPGNPPLYMDNDIESGEMSAAAPPHSLSHRGGASAYPYPPIPASVNGEHEYDEFPGSSAAAAGGDTELTSPRDPGAFDPSFVPTKICSKCNRIKPPRTHHCSVCKVCVLKMDHHCPWLNNCVGFHNYRYFLLFLTHLALACLFVVVTFMPTFLQTVHSKSRAQRDPSEPPLTAAAKQCITLSFVISVSIFCALLVLGGFHAWLVVSNQTTIEFQSNLVEARIARQRGELYRNPFNLGRSRNFEQVFGEGVKFWSFRWLFPYLCPPPVGDGMSFKVIGGINQPTGPQAV